MVQKNGKSGLNNGATMKFGESNYLMKKDGFKSGSFIRKLYNEGGDQVGVRGQEFKDRRVRHDSGHDVLSGELESLHEVEDTGGVGLPIQSAQDQNFVYVSLNKQKRWDLLEKLKDHVQLQRVCEEKVQSINSPVLGITLVEKYGDYLYGRLSSKSLCSYLSYDSSKAPANVPVSARGNTAYLWDLRNKYFKTESRPKGKSRKSSQHNQHFRGLQRKAMADRKTAVSCLSETKPESSSLSDPGKTDCPEVVYEITYPRPLDSSSGSQCLKVNKWNWSFRDRKSRSKSKGQKISRRADYYCLSQKELKNWETYGDVDNDYMSYPRISNEPMQQLYYDTYQEPIDNDTGFNEVYLDFETNPFEDVGEGLFESLIGENDLGDFEKIMLTDHMNEENLTGLEKSSHFVTRDTHGDMEIVEQKPRDPCFPWGTPFELSMVKVDEDTLLEAEFEFLETPDKTVLSDEFEVVDNKKKQELNNVDGVLLLEKEDSGFIHVDSQNLSSSPRQTVTLADFIKRDKTKRPNSKGAKSRKNLKKKS